MVTTGQPMSFHDRLFVSRGLTLTDIRPVDLGTHRTVNACRGELTAMVDALASALDESSAATRPSSSSRIRRIAQRRPAVIHLEPS